MRKSSTPATQVQLEIENEVARITFTGSKGIQILGAETRAALNGVLEEIEANSKLRIVLFQATGRTFIAGADIHEFVDLDETRGIELVRQGQQLMSRIATLPAITIAAINGACAGGGFELAIACDFRFAISSAKIGLPETTLGLLPCWGGTVRTTVLFGAAVALQLILTGELFVAEKAKQLGIIHEMGEEQEWESFVSQKIETLLLRGPVAQREAKRLIQKTKKNSSQIELGLTHEQNSFLEIIRSGELQIGALAFLEKQKPSWK